MYGRGLGYELLGNQPFFKEFALKCPRPVAEINAYLLNEWGVIGGYALGADYPTLTNTMLVCVTEMSTKEGIDTLVEALGAMEEEI